MKSSPFFVPLFRNIKLGKRTRSFDKRVSDRLVRFVLMAAMLILASCSCDSASAQSSSDQNGKKTFGPPDEQSIPASVRNFIKENAPKIDSLAKSPQRLEQLANELEGQFENRTIPEAIRMFIAIARGSRMGTGGGWFESGVQKFDWVWLAELNGIEPDESIKRDDFRGDKFFFDRLDRNKDGVLEEADFDWSDESRFVGESGLVSWFFRRLDQDGDGRATKQEVLKFYDSTIDGKESMSVEQLRDALITGSSGYLPGDEPTQERLVRGLFSSEVGSLGEGPGIGQEAPDFALRTQDGSKVIHLKDEIGKKPVVLVFGNFTCGPFRRNFPEVEDIHQHYKDRATFIGVYVREAHPSDGWLMESNTQNGVLLAQPKTYDERKAVAQRCATTLRYSMPLLVDEIDDPVGNAYSGMPSRMYVIDKDGIVTYKSGRGPFGFKIGEMEQSLALTLLNAEQPAKKGE